MVKQNLDQLDVWDWKTWVEGLLGKELGVLLVLSLGETSSACGAEGQMR